MNTLSIKSLVYVYTTLAFVGLFIGRIKFGFWFFGFQELTFSNIAVNILTGISVAIPVIYFSTISLTRFKWAGEMEKLFSQVLVPLKTSEIAIIAVTSGICEEIFFRGGLQPILGLVITSMLFGLAHFPFKRELVPWTIMATLMGFVLGLLFNWSGSLIAPIAAHVAINFINILILNRRSRSRV